MEKAVSRIVADLEAHQTDLDDSHHQTQTPISESTLLDLQKLVDNAFNDRDPEGMNRLYVELSSRNLSPASLVCSISSTMDSGPTHLSLLASKVYLSLLLSPNAPVFTLFTPMSFLSLLRSIRRSLKHRSPPPATDREHRGRGSHVVACRKRKGKSSRNLVRNVDFEDGGDASEENVFDVRVLFSVLERVELVLGLMHLGRFPDSLKSLIQTVAEIPVTAVELCGGSGNYTKLCDLCSRILSELLKPEHGDQAITAAEVLKSLSPSILLLKSQARTCALEFVKTRMITAARDSLVIKKAIVNLPRYLVLKAPEKSEPRALAVESIMEIVCTMEFDDQIEFAGYVLKMSKGKPHLRLLAVDLVPVLMMSLRDSFMASSESEGKTSLGLRCLEALIQRFSDASAAIRARALSNMGQLVEFFSGDDRSLTLLKRVIGFGNVGECGINVLLRKRCMDEKAAVRKAALLLITKLTAALDGAFDADLLKTVGMACSDPLVSIRKAAVSALSEVNAHVKALRTLCKRKANPEEADVLVMKWVYQLLPKASQVIEMFISKNSDANDESSFFTPPRSESRKSKKAMAVSRLLSQAVTACYTIGSLVIVCPSADLNAIIPVLHSIITSGNFNPKLKKFPVPAVSIKQTAPSLYIQAWLTMGKICLADGKLAKKYIPLFVQELEKSDNAALRNNIVVMMADFCVRYTALVDCYISKITKCLCDPCELVRRQTFILLSRLLQRDYVKWRGVLFLRFLLSLVDESEKIRQLADYLFGNILKAKAPLLAYNSFVEAIFVLNDCRTHNGHTELQSLQTENRIFSIRGNDEKSRSKRMHIYISLLKQMAPEHLLATFAKLCAEILATASDGILNIEDVTGQSVLQDVFQILACKEIRIPSNRLSSDSADMDEEGGDTGASAVAARGRAITQAVKKGLVQNIIPIFIELKRLLESKNSPLTGSLMECLRILLKDYKNEIDEILVADKQLQKELLYDMQKYESAKAKSTAAKTVATLQSSGHILTPHGSSKFAVKTDVQNKFTKQLQSSSKVASAMADAAAAATAQSVLKEVNRGAFSPPLNIINMPKLKSSMERTASQGNKPVELLQSLRRRQSFSSDDEN
ncbi:uncharacterized protein LOC131150308 isoform X2 [Malania oleifera]|uniref:uncharacterized protein LOC131150308 isoform X2 n=1 Tax=Malania oleifera TaxID=397392 RepID=UPI0025ADC62F|nr:uncharacterized protein LOC131150308 isoform X2 [Malania oleifera]